MTGPVSARRKGIPLSIKAKVLAVQTRLAAAETVATIIDGPAVIRAKCETLTLYAFCAACGDPLARFQDIRFDHRPALVARPWDNKRKDFIPPQNDPDAIEAIHSDCHDERTFGRKRGALKTVTTRGSDVGEAARARSISAKHQAFLEARKIGRKPRKEDKTSKKWKRKQKIPSRPFRSKKK